MLMCHHLMLCSYVCTYAAVASSNADNLQHFFSAELPRKGAPRNTVINCGRISQNIMPVLHHEKQQVVDRHLSF